MRDFLQLLVLDPLGSLHTCNIRFLVPFLLDFAFHFHILHDDTFSQHFLPRHACNKYDMKSILQEPL